MLAFCTEASSSPRRGIRPLRRVECLRAAIVPSDAFDGSVWLVDVHVTVRVRKEGGLAVGSDLDLTGAAAEVDDATLRP